MPRSAPSYFTSAFEEISGFSKSYYTLLRTYRGPFGIPRPLVPPPCQHGFREVLPSVLSNFKPMTGATCLPPMSKINCRVLYQISLANCKGEYLVEYPHLWDKTELWKLGMQLAQPIATCSSGERRRRHNPLCLVESTAYPVYGKSSRLSGSCGHSGNAESVSQYAGHSFATMFQSVT